MKTIIIAFLVLCFTASVGNTNENNIINKIATHISNEIQDIKEFQKDNWEKGKRSEEHTSELQSRLHLVCRLLLEN